MRLAIVAAFFLSAAWGQPVARPRITGVAHIGLYSHDIDKSRAFYTDFLGFQESLPLKGPDGALRLTFLKINDRQYIELFPEKEAGTDRLAHIAIETDDAAGMLKYLASQGVKTPAQVSKSRVGATTVNVTDPDGHIIEFVQYDPEGQQMRDAGKFMDNRRMATEMSHVGFIVNALEPAMKFYRDILGCKEIWRGSQDGKFLSWVNMKLPDSNQYVEFMLYDKLPDLTRLGILNHIGLEAPDMTKVVATMEAQPGRKAYTRPVEMRGSRRQLQVYDPDGTRTEAMQPVPADAPLVSSTAPPIR